MSKLTRVESLLGPPKSRPPQDYWKITQTPDSNCINQTWSLLVAGVVNALTDLIAVLLPIRTVWTLQLPARQVAIVLLLFSLGFVSCIAGIIRTYFMYRVTKEFDQTWNSYPVWITSAVELYIGMVSFSPKQQAFYLCPSQLIRPDMCLDTSNQAILHKLPSPSLRCDGHSPLRIPKFSTTNTAVNQYCCHHRQPP